MDKDVIIGGNWNILNKKYEGDLIFNKSNGGIILDIYYNNPKEFLAWSDKPTEITEITGYNLLFPRKENIEKYSIFLTKEGTNDTNIVMWNYLLTSDNY